jgi:anti-sigma factor RsiW
MSDDDLLYDYLDGLLDAAQAREAEARIARDPARLAEIARRRAILYRPYPVPPSPERLVRPRARPALRYAAAFLLGALAALLLRPRLPDPPPAPPSFESEPAVMNRRLR